MTRTDMERRRVAAIASLKAGKPPGRLAIELGVSRNAVSVWQRRYADGNLGMRKAPGRRPRLDRGELEQLALAGPLAAGIDRNAWTSQSFATAIAKRFGIAYHRDHAGRMLTIALGPRKTGRAAAN